MTALGVQIVWLAVRVTGIGLLAAVLARWCARRAARSTVLVLASAIAVNLVLGMVAFCPAPDLGRWSISGATPLSDEKIADLARVDAESADHDMPAAGISVAGAWHLLRNLSSQPPQSPAWQQAGTIVVVLYGMGLAIAGLRLVFGWLAVRSLRRSSRPIRDAGLLQLTDALRNALGCSRHVALQECREPGLAATVGWWRPVIFLPPEWPEWTEAEQRAVLAHELAHICSGDYLIGVATRACQALYFYHPLVRWLSKQLRWQQELAADELAASGLADRSLYLKALASLALRSPARMPAGAMPWSAMTGGTLLRRIQVLHTTEKSRPLGWAMRGLMMGLLICSGLLLATLGSSATPPEPPAETTQPFEIGYMTPDTRGLIAIRPAFLLKQPGMHVAKPQIAAVVAALKNLGFTLPDELKPDGIEEIVTSFEFQNDETGKSKSPQLLVDTSSLFIRLNHDFDWPAFFKSASRQLKEVLKTELELTEMREDGLLIYRVGAIPALGPIPIYFHMPDRRSIVFSSVPKKATSKDIDVFRALIRDVAVARKRDWGTGFKAVARAPIAVVLDNSKDQYGKLFAKELDATQLQIVRNTRFAAVGIEVGEDRPVRLVLDAKSAAATMDLEKGVEDYFRSIVDFTEHAKIEPTPLLTLLVSELWKSRNMNRSGARLEWLGYSCVRLQHLYCPPDETPGNELRPRKRD